MERREPGDYVSACPVICCTQQYTAAIVAALEAGKKIAEHREVLRHVSLIRRT
jgi:hypothetical protein